MAFRGQLQAFIGVAVIALSGRALARAAGFIAPGAGQRWQGDRQGLASPRADRGRLGLVSTAKPDAVPRAFEHHSGLESSETILGFALGLSLVGATLSRRLRGDGVRTSCASARIRNKHVFGGSGPPKEPGWLTHNAKTYKIGQDRKPRDLPKWLTREKFMSLSAGNRSRHLRWLLYKFDKAGNPVSSLTSARTITHPIEKAVDLVMSMVERVPFKKDVTVECRMQMGLDPRYPDQQIRFTVNLPHGTGKKVKVAVFCDASEEEEVLAMGAHKAGMMLAEEISEEKIDFDVLLTKPAMMPRLAKLGKILGPKKLMPSPKSGTVVTNFKEAIEAFQGGALELRNNQDMFIPTVIGKTSFGRQKLTENLRALLQQMAEKAPPGATGGKKGKSKTYFKHIQIKLATGPAVVIDPSEFPRVVAKAEA